MSTLLKCDNFIIHISFFDDNMMNEDLEKFNLTWHTYSEHLQSMLHEMMVSSDLTDVTLVCDDKKNIQAHKVVLSACSPIFKHIVDSMPRNEQHIYLRGIKSREMEMVLEFMYLGQVNLQPEKINQFIEVAKSLEIKEICKDIEIKQNEQNKTTESVEEDVEPVKDAKQEVSENLNEPPPEIAEVPGPELPTEEENLEEDLDDEEEVELDEIELEEAQNINFEAEVLINEADSLTETFNDIVAKDVEENESSESEGKEFPCSMCDYRATLKMQLKTHRKKHVKEIGSLRRWICLSCNYSSNQAGNIGTHFKNIHAGIKFECPQCDHKSSLKQNLKIHMKRHEK